MKIKIHLICSLLVLGLSLLVSGCQVSGENQGEKTVVFSSYRDIPGVTGQEIAAIEKLQRERTSFVYGVLSSTEAFGENGSIGGFSALFCDWLSGLFKIPFIPTVFEWSDLLTGLTDGKIDFNGDLTPTEERREVLFMTDPIASRVLKYFRLYESPAVSEIDAERPLRIVFFDGSTTYGHVISTKPLGSFEALFVTSLEAAYDLLKSGRADTIIEESHVEASFDIYSDIVSEDYSFLIFNPFAMATADPELEPIISAVTKALQGGAMPHMFYLYNQGAREYKRHKLLFSLNEEEKAYLKRIEPVPLAAQYFNYPIVFYDDHEKKWDGITFALLREVENLTGLTFEVINDGRTEMGELMAMLDDGRAYMFSDLIFSAEREPYYIWADYKYMTDQFALLSKIDFPNISINEIPYARVALIKNTAHAEMFLTWFPGAVNYIVYETMDDAFLALEKDEVEMVMAAKSKLLYYSHYFEFSGYKANYLFNHFYGSAFAFNRDQYVLCSIMDKAFTIIDTDRYVDQWLTKTYDYKAQILMVQRPWLIGAIILSFAVIVLISIVSYFFVSAKKKAVVMEMQKAEIAEGSNRAKSRFLAIMSHEIRTPINSIMGFAELSLDMMDNDIAPQLRDYTSKIKESTKWLLKIINDILDISKIESGKFELENMPFDLYDIFMSCQSVILPEANEKGLDLNVYAEPIPGKKLMGDSLRLYQALLNLLSNAVKFTDSGIVKFSSIVKKTEEDKVTIYFEVKDTGIGLTSEQVEKIFDPFTQAQSNTTRNYGGTGLGLSITKIIVEMMGGELSVQSSPGMGSSFSFEIVFDTIEASDDDTADYEKLGIIEKPHFEGFVLVCDDNHMNQQVICDHLANVGFKTVVAANGKTGVEKVREKIQKNEKPFDLIFMDIFMPVMDGIEAASKIMSLNTGTPIVALTANIMGSELEKYKRHGMQDCLSKPFTTQELWNILMKYLEPVKVSVMDKRHLTAAEEKMLKHLRLNFLKSNKNSFIDIKEAADEGNKTLAKRLTHTLKGNAGQIGEQQLREAALALENIFKEEQNLPFNKQMETLSKELELVLNKLSSMNLETDLSGRVIDEKEKKELFEKLGPMLLSHDPQCMNLLDELRCISGTKELVRQIEEFEFKKAAIALEKLTQGDFKPG